MSLDLSKYKKLSEKAGVSKGKLNNNYMFTILAADLFYFENDIKISDIQDGFVDGSGDGGIDFITVYEDELKILQGKSGKRINYETIINCINKIIDTINALNIVNHNNLNNHLVSKFINARDSLNDDSDIEIIIVSGASISKNLRQRIKTTLKEKKYSNYHFKIIDIEDLENKNFELLTYKEYVEYGTLSLSSTNGYLEFEDSYLTNIKASSLKELYKKSSKSLFNYNLREYIVNKQVDNGIDKTIENNKDKFWYFNNGITIICSDCFFDGNNVKIDNFSIINGAQTTTKIGNSKMISKIDDLDLVCKIVVIKNWHKNKDGNFINDISKATNSQKPIIPRDLQSNSREQIALQKNAAQNKEKSLAIEIKRGLKAPNFDQVDSSYRIKNDELGQLILSCLLQKPGTARSAKRKIFENKKIYNQVFIRTMDYDTLFDLVKLSNYYKKYKEKRNTEYKLNNNEDESIEIIVMQYAKFITLAIIFYFIKIKRNKIDSYIDSALFEDNINGTIISKYKKNDFEEILNEMFTVIIQLLSDIFEKNIDEAKTPSNFFKTDKNYHTIILKDIENITNRIVYKDNFEKYMNIFD